MLSYAHNDRISKHYPLYLNLKHISKVFLKNRNACSANTYIYCTPPQTPWYSSNDSPSIMVFQLELHWFLYIQVLESRSQMSHLVSCRSWKYDRSGRSDTLVRKSTRCASQWLTSTVQASWNETHRFTSGWHQQAGGSKISWKVQISGGAPTLPAWH